MWAGFMYLAIVLDVFSRRIVGWAMENHLQTELQLSAIERAELSSTLNALQVSFGGCSRL